MADQQSKPLGVPIGVSGLNTYGDGRIYEEWDPALIGPRGRIAYREMMDNDPIIGAILFSIEMLMRQVDWSIQPASEDTADTDAASFLDSCLHDMEATWEDQLSEILSFLGFGWSLHEITYKRRTGENSNYPDGRIGWRGWPIRGQETLSYWQFDPQTWEPTGMVQLGPPDWREHQIPLDKAMLFRTTTRKNNPEGRSLLRNAHRPWYFKKNLEQIEAIGVERDLAGVPIAYIPAEELVAQGEMFRAVQKIVTQVKRDENNGIVWPGDRDERGNLIYEFKLLTAGGTRSHDTDKIITRYNQQITMVVMADFIMVGHERVGSNAMVKSKSKLFTTALLAFLDSICATINDVAIPRLLKLNGYKLDKLPKLTHGDIERADLDSLGTFILNMHNSGAGMDLSPGSTLYNFLMKQGGLPEVDPEDAEEATKAAALGAARMRGAPLPGDPAVPTPPPPPVPARPGSGGRDAGPGMDNQDHPQMAEPLQFGGGGGGGHWVTIAEEGIETHLFITNGGGAGGGIVTKGPAHLIGANIAHLPPGPSRTVTHHPAGHTPQGHDQHPDYTEHQGSKTTRVYGRHGPGVGRVVTVDNPLQHLTAEESRAGLKTAQDRVRPEPAAPTAPVHTLSSAREALQGAIRDNHIRQAHGDTLLQDLVGHRTLSPDAAHALVDELPRVHAAIDAAIEPGHISAMHADHLHLQIRDGERTPAQMHAYLNDIRDAHGAISTAYADGTIDKGRSMSLHDSLKYRNMPASATARALKGSDAEVADLIQAHASIGYEQDKGVINKEHADMLRSQVDGGARTPMEMQLHLAGIRNGYTAIKAAKEAEDISPAYAATMHEHLASGLLHHQDVKAAIDRARTAEGRKIVDGMLTEALGNGLITADHVRVLREGLASGGLGPYQASKVLNGIGNGHIIINLTEGNKGISPTNAATLRDRLASGDLHYATVRGEIERVMRGGDAMPAGNRILKAQTAYTPHADALGAGPLDRGYAQRIVRQATGAGSDAFKAGELDKLLGDYESMLANRQWGYAGASRATIGHTIDLVRAERDKVLGHAMTPGKATSRVAVSKDAKTAQTVRASNLARLTPEARAHVEGVMRQHMGDKIPYQGIPVSGIPAAMKELHEAPPAPPRMRLRMQEIVHERLAAYKASGGPARGPRLHYPIGVEDTPEATAKRISHQAALDRLPEDHRRLGEATGLELFNTVQHNPEALGDFASSKQLLLTTYGGADDQTVHHEYGHFLDAALGHLAGGRDWDPSMGDDGLARKGWRSNAPDFMAIYNRNKTNAELRPYLRSNPEEHFADAYGMYHHSSAGAALLERVAPDLHTFMKGLDHEVAAHLYAPTPDARPAK